jgi:hypothetical protein
MTLRYDTRSRVSTYTQSWVTNADPDFGAFESIATTVITSDTASVTFSSIPQTYKHLQVRCLMRNTEGASGQSGLYMRFNSDTASNYSWHRLYGDGASVTSGASTSTSSMLAGIGARTGSLASTFGVAVIDVLDYVNTNKYTTIRGLTGHDTNGGGYASLGSGNWRNTAAVTTIDLITDATFSFVQYSSFALYGIRG